MKLLNLRKRIITNLSIFGALLVLLSLIILFDSHKKQSAQDQAANIEQETVGIRKRTSDLQNKISEAQKYQEIWKTISPSKKTIGSLKIDDITDRIDALSDKYSIEKPTIKMTIPEDLQNGIFKRQTVNIIVSNAAITFDAVNDLKAIAFVSEFTQSVPGYIVITNFEMRRTKQYNPQDLVKISTGQDAGAVTAKLDFFWYIYKAKPELQKVETPKP